MHYLNYKKGFREEKKNVFSRYGKTGKMIQPQVIFYTENNQSLFIYKSWSYGNEYQQSILKENQSIPWLPLPRL